MREGVPINPETRKAMGIEGDKEGASASTEQKVQKMISALPEPLASHFSSLSPDERRGIISDGRLLTASPEEITKEFPWADAPEADKNTMIEAAKMRKKTEELNRQKEKLLQNLKVIDAMSDGREKFIALDSLRLAFENLLEGYLEVDGYLKKADPNLGIKNEDKNRVAEIIKTIKNQVERGHSFLTEDDLRDI